MKRLIVTILGSSLLLLVTLLALSTQAGTGILPGITGITPDTGPNDRQTPITITGQGFTTSTLAYLNDIPLLRLTFVDSATLQARVPFGLVTGVYTLTVTDTETVSLTSAFTVTQGSGWATGGPYGGEVERLAIAPVMTNTVYAFVLQSGVYRTTDSGRHWDLALSDHTKWGGMVEIWPISPTVVFAGTQAGLYRSEQSGDLGSWVLVIPNTTTSLKGASLAIASSDPYTMYTAQGRIFWHSSDGGKSWQQRVTLMPGEVFYHWKLAVDPNDAATIYAGESDKGRLYKTADGGQSWTQLPFVSPGTLQSMTTDPFRPGNIWLGTSSQGLYRSIDSGQTFTQVTALPSQLGVKSIRFDPNRDRILVGGSNWYYSDDSGNLWQSIGCGGCMDLVVATGDSNTIYGAKNGVLKTTDAGLTWTKLSEGIAGVQPWKIAVSPDDSQRVLMVASKDRGFGSHNSGNEWTSLVRNSGGLVGNKAVTFDPISPSIAYVDSGSEIIKTTDDGQIWQGTAALPTTEFPSYDELSIWSIVVHPQTHTTIYAGVGLRINTADNFEKAGGIYRSNDGGDSWTLITTTGSISSVGRIALAPIHPETIYLALGAPMILTVGAGDGILRSGDGGQTWTRPQPGLPGTAVTALTVNPDDPNTLLAGVWGETGNGIRYSTDGGDSWDEVSGLVGDERRLIYDIVYDPADSRIVYAATQGGLMISFNGGQSWQVYPGPVGEVPILALAIARYGVQTHLYLGTVGGAIAVQPALFRPTPAYKPQATQAELLLGGGVYLKQGRAPFTAGFTATPTSGAYPLKVAFADTSLGIVTDWLWDFGDTFTSTQTNPTHTYSTTGVYTVVLTVSGPDGTDTLTRTNYITVTEPPHVPKWIQRNLDGFGLKENTFVSALEVFDGQLYVGTTNYGSGALIRRSTTGLAWTRVITFGFGSAYTNTNAVLSDMTEFKGQLYAGTGNWSNDGVGGQIWRSPNGTDWTLVEGNGFGNADNTGIVNFGVFSDTLYACTYNTVNGLDVWRSSTGNNGDWTRVISNGFTSGSHYPLCTGLTVFDGYLYAAVEGASGASAQVWRAADGLTWNQVHTNGFGDPNNTQTGGWATFNGYLYVGTRNDVTGAQLWRSNNGVAWTQVISVGFGNLENYKIEALIAFDGYVYAATDNNATGVEVWRSRDGMMWEQANLDGFGDINNAYILWSNAAAAFNNRLFIGTGNIATGGELWQKAIAADFAASPISGAVPLAVTFTNLSDGDYTNSLWNLGDSITSTQTSLTHAYTKGGIFTVTLTVSDDVDTSTSTHASYIQVMYRVYLPLVMRSP